MGLENGKNILIADTPQDFADAVLRLLSDSALRDRISNEGINFIRENLSTEAVAKKLYDLFYSLSKSHKAPNHKPVSPISRYWVIVHHLLDKYILWRFRE